MTDTTKKFILDFYKNLTQERDVESLAEMLRHFSSPEYREWWIEQSRENVPNIERLITFHSDKAREFMEIEREIANEPENLRQAAASRRMLHESQVTSLRKTLEELRAVNPEVQYDNMIRGYRDELEAALKIEENKEKYEQLKKQFGLG